MDIGPLRPDEALSLAGEYFDLNNRFVMSCVERAEGNPLYLEQLLRNADENADEAVPGSVQSIVLARMDSLEPLDRQALQAAAVIGQRFSLELVRHLIESPSYTCAGLVEQYLVRPRDDDFLFAHALVRDGVYSSLLTSRRRELHRRAAEWFGERDLALSAEHLDRAEDPDAPLAYAEAAAFHVGLYRFERALEMVQRGMAIAEKPAIRHRLLMLEGECLRETGHPADSIVVYRHALEAADDEADRCRAWIGLAAGMRVTDDYDEALDALARAEAAARAQSLHKELSDVHYYRGNLYFPLGNIDGCLEEHRKALDAAERAGSPECEVRALSGLGDAYYSRGRMLTSLDYFRRCIDLCQEHGFGRIAVANQYMVAWNQVYLTEMTAARDGAEQAIEAAEQVGHRRAEMVARLTAARVQLIIGEVEAAEANAERGLDLANYLGANRFVPFLTIHLAQARYLRQGYRAESVAMLEAALEIARETGIGFLGPWVLGTLALVADDIALSRAALAEGEQLLAGDCVGHNYFAFYPRAIEVALRDRDWNAAERYATALEDYARPEPVPWSDFVAARARVLEAHGRGDGGLEEELSRLQRQAADAGMHAAKAAIDVALGM
jgi:tetratricopeptide (TPR) repeat protein